MGETRFRPAWRQFPWWLWITPVGAIRPVRSGMLSPWSAVAIAALELATSFWFMTRGADLRPDGLVIRGVRRRVVPWHSITWVGDDRRWGGTHVGAVRTRDGRLLRLRAPTHVRFFAPDPQYDAKVERIHDYWAAHREPAWAVT